MTHGDISPIEDENEATIPQTLPRVRSGYAKVSQLEAQTHASSTQEDSSSKQPRKEQTEASEVQPWPICPQPLHQSLTLRLLIAIVDIALIVFPILFLGVYFLTCLIPATKLIVSSIGRSRLSFERPVDG
jgi:hypothetical protein